MFPLCVIVIVASLVLGGGTRSGFLSDAILQLIAIPLLLVSLWRLLETPLTKQMRVALFFCFASVAIPLIQLIPLPPWLCLRYSERSCPGCPSAYHPMQHG